MMMGYNVLVSYEVSHLIPNHVPVDTIPVLPPICQMLRKPDELNSLTVDAAPAVRYRVEAR
jgi:hypothetical protein